MITHKILIFSLIVVLQIPLIAFSQEQVVAVENDHLVEIGSGLRFQNYVMGGDGLQSDFPLELNFPIHLGYEGKLKNHDLKFSYNQYSIEHVSNDAAPSTFTLSKVEADLLKMTPHKIFEVYDFGLGIYYDKRNVETTTPEQLISPRAQHGILLHIENIKKNSDSISLYHEFELGLPLYFNEGKEKSGSYQYGYIAKAGCEIRYKVVEWQEWSVGAYADWSYFKYSGPGEKSSLNATESEFGITIPVNLRIRF